MSKWVDAADDIIDFNALGKAIGISDPAILKMLYRKFFETVYNDANKVLELAEGDLVDLAPAAHKIKGAAQNLRLTKIGGLAEEIEHQAKAGVQAEYGVLAVALIASLQRVEAAFKEAYK